MGKRSDTHGSALLAIELLKRIPRNRTVSAPELCEQLSGSPFARDLRTIQRQLDMLAEHFGIDRDISKKPYRYCYKERAQGLSLPALTEQESLLLTLAEQHLRPLLPAKLMNSMSGFFEQARIKIGSGVKARRENEWLAKVRVVSTTQPLIPPKIKAGVFDEVSNALYANLVLEVEYLNSSGKRTEANVMPLGLAQQGPCLYLVCRFEGYADERSLALHRIAKARSTTLGFERPRDFDLQKFDADGGFGFGNGKRIRLSFRIDKEVGRHLLETPLSLDQKVTDMGDEYRISATVVDSGQLEWWLRSFGDAIQNVRRTKVRPLMAGPD